MRILNPELSSFFSTQTVPSVSFSAVTKILADAVTAAVSTSTYSAKELLET
jgi:hypothetical protein